jgi:hypothetical protein
MDTTKLDNWTLHNAIVELEELFPEMIRIPRLGYDTQMSWSGKVEHVEILDMGEWSIKCYADRLHIAQKYYHTISLPPIMYSEIESISFDTYIDSSKLVAIWIDTYSGQRWTVSTAEKI